MELWYVLVKTESDFLPKFLPNQMHLKAIVKSLSNKILVHHKQTTYNQIYWINKTEKESVFGKQLEWWRTTGGKKYSS